MQPPSLPARGPLLYGCPRRAWESAVGFRGVMCKLVGSRMTVIQGSGSIGIKMIVCSLGFTALGRFEHYKVCHG